MRVFGALKLVRKQERVDFQDREWQYRPVVAPQELSRVLKQRLLIDRPADRAGRESTTLSKELKKLY